MFKCIIYVSIEMPGGVSVSELDIIVSDPTCVMTRCPCVCLGLVKSVACARTRVTVNSNYWYLI